MGRKAEKRWLEAWFALGELMIVRRDRFQRVYDLRERVLEKLWPGWSDHALPIERRSGGPSSSRASAPWA